MSAQRRRHTILSILLEVVLISVGVFLAMWASNWRAAIAGMLVLRSVWPLRDEPPTPPGPYGAPRPPTPPLEPPSDPPLADPSDERG